MRHIELPCYLLVRSESFPSWDLRLFCWTSKRNFKFPSMVDACRSAFQHGRCIVSAIGRANLCRQCLGRAIAAFAVVAISAGPACAQVLSFAPAFRSDPVLPQYAPQQQDDPSASEQLPAQFRRQMVTYPTNEAPGTIIIDTAHTFLYLTLGRRMAMRYGIGVGRQGFTWSGVETIARKSEWPDWIPPAQMVARQPYLPRWVGGGPGNPLGARALYLGNTEYRIHGTNDPSSIGKHVSSGCIRLQNADIIDLYSRVGVGTKVVLLTNDQRRVLRDDDNRMVLQDPPIGARMPVQIAVQPAAQTRESVSSRRGLSGLY
jgi:lipoprotein-anchoring transpeptidase ErfK/SrfK